MTYLETWSRGVGGITGCIYKYFKTQLASCEKPFSSLVGMHTNHLELKTVSQLRKKTDSSMLAKKVTKT